jgi:hypothetical protein
MKCLQNYHDFKSVLKLKAVHKGLVEGVKMLENVVWLTDWVKLAFIENKNVTLDSLHVIIRSKFSA